MAAGRDKQVIILNILSGATQLDSPVIERSVLSAIAERPRPDLKDPEPVWFGGIPALLVMLGAMILYREHLEDPVWLAGAILSLLSVFLVVWHMARSRDEALRSQVKILQEPLEELKELRTMVKNYLENLDRRTSKYFHVVTNSKVTSYFILTQVAQALGQRIEEISNLLGSPSRESVLISHQLLQGTLVFRDSFNGAGGNTHVVPLARIKTAVLQLFDFLDSELKLLEDEMATRAEELQSSLDEQGEPH